MAHKTKNISSKAMELLLQRTYYTGGTNGMLFTDGIYHSNTIELPWKQNKPKLSCIPEGKYRVVKRHSEKFGDHLMLEKVKGRDLILIHPANNALKELKGCIAPVTTLCGEGKGLQSRKALEGLLQKVWVAMEEGKEVWLTVES